MKRYLNRIFIEGLGGMALGLFATLIIGTILVQIGTISGGFIGKYFVYGGNIAKTITGAGIGIGVASKFKETPLVCVGAAVAGMIGAFPGTEGIVLSGRPGEPLGAFIAAFAAIEAGRLVSGKTKMDIIITPFVSIGAGAVAGFVIGPYISRFMYFVGEIVNVNVEKSPIIGGIIISVAMGIMLTLPISSAAIGISMGITGLAAGAAVVGCCCQMVGFAVCSYKENGIGGLLAQGLGTSMLQMPNIIKNPFIWIPSIVASGILGPVSSAFLKMRNTPVGSGMGTSGLVGQFGAYDAMTIGNGSVPVAMIEILFMHFLLPGVVAFIVYRVLLKAGWIRKGDMKIKV